MKTTIGTLAGTFVLLALLACPAAQAAPTVYTWNGTVSSDFTNAANWGAGGVAPTGVTGNYRISVANGANFPLIYTAAQGTTTYTSDLRSLFLSSPGNSSMSITGGTFKSEAKDPDGMVNGAWTSTLTIDGGSYINTSGSGARTFLMMFGGGTATLNVNSGLFAVDVLKWGDSASTGGTATLNLNGGQLSVGRFTDSGTTVSNVNLNGGLLQALSSEPLFMQGLDSVKVLSGGALIGTNSYDITIGQALTDGGGGGGLTKQDAGTLTLTGANTYTGLTTVSGGVLAIQNASALGTTAGGTTVASGARLALQGGITVTGESLTINGLGNNIGALQSASGNNTWAGPVILNGSSDTRVGAESGTLTISGAIQDGTTNRIRVRNNTGTTIFSGANTYTGRTDVLVGTLKIAGGDNRLPVGTELRVGVNGTGGEAGFFDLNGFNQTVAGLGCDGRVESAVTNNGPADATFTLNNSAAYTYSGKLASGTSKLNFVKTGSGDLTLSGDNSGLTGTATLNQGRIFFASEASGSASAAWDVKSNSVIFNNTGLAGARTLKMGSLTGTAGAVVRNGGNEAGTTTFEIGGLNTSTTYGGIFQDFDGDTITALTKVGSGTLTLTGDSTCTGTTTIKAGTVSVAQPASLGYSNVLTLAGGRLQVTGAAFSANKAINLTADSTIEAVGGASATFQQGVNGGFGLTKEGNGSLVLTAAGTFTGAMNVNAGTLVLRHGSALGATAGATSVANGASLQLQGGIAVGAEALTIGGDSIAVGGALRNISGDNSWAGPITMRSATASRIASDAGTLTLSGPITSTGNSLYLSGAGNGLISGNIAGLFQLVKQNSGTWTLGGTNTYTTPTYVQDGTLALTGTASIAASPTIGISAPGTLNVAGLASTFTLLPGQTLTGSGRVVGPMNVQGDIRPGSSPGILTVGNTQFQADSTLYIELNGHTAGTQYDRLASTGLVDLGLGVADLDILLGFAPVEGAGFTIITADGGLSGFFRGYEDGSVFERTYGGHAYGLMVDYQANALVLTAVPEPASLSLLGLAAAGLAGYVRRRRR